MADELAVDRGLLAAGLRARLGDRADGWGIAVAGDDADAPVVATLTRPDGTVIRRELALMETDPSARARELASALALVIDADTGDRRQEGPSPLATAAADPTVQAAASPAIPTRSAVWWVEVGARLGFGSREVPDVDGGGTVELGVVLPRTPVALSLRGTSAHARSEGLALDGGTLAFGARLGGPRAGPGRRFHVWWGAGAHAGASWVRAVDRETAAAWFAHGSLRALARAHLADARGRMWVVGLDAGIELWAPTLTARGDQGRASWGPVRGMVALVLGWRSRA